MGTKRERLSQLGLWRISLAGLCLFCLMTPVGMAQEPQCSLTGTPTVAGVANSASFQAAISANSMVSIFGSGFAPVGTSRAVSRLDFAEGKFPKELACVAVEVAGQRGPVIFVGSNQINAQLPSLTVTGPAEVRVVLNPGRANEIRGASTSVPVQARAPAFFTFAGPAIAAQHSTFEPLADPAVVPTGRPAKPGDLIILYGTGFGATVPAFQAGEIPDRPALLLDSASITVGGVAVRPEDILYAGLSPGSISGLYQFNVRLPATVSPGDVPVVIEVGGVRTQTGATIPVRQPRLLRVPADFRTIQAAVNAANPGDVVQVSPGRYVENVKITKNGLRLLAPVSSGDQRAVVDGTGLFGSGIQVVGTPDNPVSGVEVMGFVVQNFEQGIMLQNAVLSRVHLNTADNNVDKVEPFSAAQADAMGIVLRAAHFNEVVQNFARENGDSGIEVLGGSSNNTIRGNHLARNGYPVSPPPWPGAWSTTAG